MADTKVSALAAATAFLLADEIPVNEAGNSKKVTGTQMAKVLPTLATPVRVAPGDPTGRTGGSVMMGIGSSCTYTPASTGRVFIMLSGTCANSLAVDGVVVAGRYGSGTAPTNGAAVVGTAFTANKNPAGNNAAGRVGWAAQGVVSGLSLGTAYWFDIALGNTIGGTVNVYDIDFTIFEI